MEHAALGLAERSEEVVLDLLGSVSCLLEAAATTSREVDEVATPVDRIAAANDVPFGFESVDDGHQVAGVNAQRLTEAPLRDRALIRQPLEDGEVMRVHSELG